MSLADLKGNVVLVVFWASWCLPSSTEIAALDQVYSTLRPRGFRVIGINVDTLQGDGPKLETVLPNIRRFLLDNNVRWPNLINGTGTNDYAKAYGVTEIPSNVLIGRDGNVIHLDLSPRKNLESVVSRSLASRPERSKILTTDSVSSMKLDRNGPYAGDWHRLLQVEVGAVGLTGIAAGAVVGLIAWANDS